MALTPLIDCDVHQELVSEDDILPYMSQGWREFVLAKGDSGRGGRNAVSPPVYSFAQHPFGFERGDSWPPNGNQAGSAPDFMLQQLSESGDPRGIVLTGGEAHKPSAIANPYFAAEIARAANDHLVDAWLDVDKRFLGSIVPAIQVPQWGADEIRRCAAKHGSKFIQVILWSNPLPWAFGHPIYTPMHEAANETGLPIAIHSLGEGYASGTNAVTASGSPALYAEFHVGGGQGMMTHLMSFIFHGVFERFPNLKLVLVEGGVTWLPGFATRMDENYKALRREMPWVKKLPSEYIRTNVRCTTQPFEIYDKNDPTLEALDRMGAEDFLLFSSDYPHWDTDAPAKIRSVMPAHWRDKVFLHNAAELYGVGERGRA